MIATGKLPPDALPMELQGSNDCVLGLEFSGHVTGSRVMGILPVKALATRVLTKPEFTWPVRLVTKVEIDRTLVTIRNARILPSKPTMCV